MNLRTFVLVNYNLEDIDGFRETPFLFESDKCTIDGAKYAKVRNRNGNIKFAKVLDIVSTSNEKVVDMMMHATGAKEPLCKVVSVFYEEQLEGAEDE